MPKMSHGTELVPSHAQVSFYLPRLLPRARIRHSLVAADQQALENSEGASFLELDPNF
jgi:hypothetical protein